MQYLKIFYDLLKYFWKQKMWWIIPALILFIIFGLLTIVVGSSPFAPIIYPLF